MYGYLFKQTEIRAPVGGIVLPSANPAPVL